MRFRVSWGALTAIGLLVGCSSADPAAAVDTGVVSDGDPTSDVAGDESPVFEAALDAAEAPDARFDDATADLTLPDGAVACAVRGVAGACIDVSTCPSDRVSTPGYCPGPKNIECCTPPLPPPGGDAGDVDAAVDGWCPTDPLARPNAGLSEAPGVGGCPAGMLPIETYCIDRYEASLVIVNSDATTTSWSPYYPPPSGVTYRAVSIEGAVPQGYIDGVESWQACEAAGKRLCTSDEWLRACRGPSNFTYPYGDSREPGVCNDHHAPHPAAECFGTTASWIYSEIQYPGINQQPGTVDRSGARTGCVTAEGAFDMMGNVHEWIDDTPATTPTISDKGIFRGGFYADTTINGDGCLYATTKHNKGQWDYSTGFRCCANKP